MNIAEIIANLRLSSPGQDDRNIFGGQLTFDKVGNYLGGAFQNYAQKQKGLQDMIHQSYDTGKIEPEIVDEALAFAPAGFVKMIPLPSYATQSSFRRAMPVHINPQYDDVITLMQKSPYFQKGYVRGIGIPEQKKIYIWDANDAIHAHILQSLDEFQKGSLRFYEFGPHDVKSGLVKKLLNAYNKGKKIPDVPQVKY